MWHEIGATYYRECLPELSTHVRFLLGRDVGILERHIDASVGVECFFLDGSDIPEQALRQFKFFERHARPGTIMMAHDWNDKKQLMLRPLVEADARWRPLVVLGPPESVGFVVYEFQPG